MPGIALPGLVNVLGGSGLGVLPLSGGGATITSYNTTTGVVSGTAPPNLLVVVSVAGAYAANTLASASGAWSATLMISASARLLSAAALPVGSFIAAATLIFSSWNPSDKSSNVTLSNSNLTATVNTASNGVRSTSSKASGKWYAECSIASTTGGTFGIANSAQSLTALSAGTANYAYAFNGSSTSGVINTSNTQAGASGSAAAAGDILAVAIDVTGGTIQWYKNNTALGSSVATPASGPLFLVGTGNTGAVMTLNVGATAFTYTPPSGYSSWG